MSPLTRKFSFSFLWCLLFLLLAPLLCQPEILAWDFTQVQDKPKAGDFAPGQLEAHYLKHGYQFGDITIEDYLQDARDLLDAKPSENILEKIRPNGDVEHYKVSTGEFAVMTRRGRIRTYFKTDFSYWSRQ